MATPTRSQAVSTPKPQPHLSTPNRLMASPRPGTSGNSNPNRPLAYKSPAVKTPASLQGHTHHISASSQPSSTPAAAGAIHDDLLALNSPAAALMASLGPTGMTPLGSGPDGLGITTSLQGTSVRGAGTPVNPEAERLHRAHLVADILKSRVAGRGVTREGVERIAQLQGFTTLWDDENLTIAGNAVDLEVIFDAADRDRVTDVSLNLNTSDSEEPQPQIRGSEILKDNLKPLNMVLGSPQWMSLDTFESNLQYLSQLDHIEGGAPCFEAVTGLYDAFQKIWNVERQKFSGRTTRQHLRRTAVGRPSLDRKPILGLALDYWCAKEDLQEKTADGEVEPSANASPHLYTARIACEPGSPSTVLAKQWVSESAITQDVDTDGDIEAAKVRPDWQDPVDNATGADQDVTADSDKPATLSSTVLDMHFVCHLLSEVYLPLNVAAHLNVDLTMVELKHELTVTYQTALQKHFNTTQAGSASTSQERWPRTLPALDEDHTPQWRRHSYALHSAQHAAALWCYPVKQLKFTHPRQLAAVIPILRQYALLWSILRSLVDGVTEHNSDPATSGRKAQSAPEGTSRPLKRSNTKTLGSQIGGLPNSNAIVTGADVLPVDLTLDIISDISRARLDVIVPLRGSLAKGRQSPFLSVSLEVCPDGKVEVKHVRGIHADNSNLRSKIARILTITEDIGLLIEWLLEKSRAEL
ncbi:hypothetical protein A1O3_02942 [Capronia epimyces CBS 606.96]|uniref:Mediator of RNA polymerase II transcription subunit 1 n=1 Tax=Capronia epimyces CBS 606.96 TaxID=1182542 RepID=W9YJN5_9EURO|nr:uncharacterized protein A1O3_02942 [Capronia epimyces CBS 606.96]EXJ89875.1 hypothetical protein A1O3_02942 [Capronia epimyces CBS 606.96]